MTIRFGSVVINCRDMGLMTAFWSAALDLVPSSDGPADGFRVLRGDRVNVSLQVAETPVGCRDQMHLDLYSPDQAAEVERLMSLGAEFIRHVEHPEDDYVVLADPENNLFCVCLDAPRG
ncbi:MAG: VOC family protein [Pseudonocardiales bacterium]